MKRYKYKNIVCFQDMGRWHADYVRDDGTHFALFRGAAKTKKLALALAKDDIDFLNKDFERRTRK